MMDKKTPNVRFQGFTDPWEQRKWIDMVKISKEMVSPLKVQYQNFRHIGPGNIEPFTGRILDNVKTAQAEGLISSKFIFHANDVLYGKINPQLGKYCVPNFDGLASADMYVLTSDNESALKKEFIYYILQTVRFYRYSVSVSMRTGMPKINRNELDLFTFAVPNIYEQEIIILLLDSIQDIIASNQRKLDQLKTLKKLLLQKIFDQEWRFKGFTDPWEQRQFKQIIQKLKAKNIDLQFGRSEGLVGASMKDTQISDSSTDEYLKTYNVIHVGEMIFEGHSSKEYKAGRFVVNDYRPGIVSHVFDVFHFTEEMDISFSKRYFHSEKVMGKILQRSTSNARMLNSLDLPQFLKQDVHLPALEEQEKLGSIFNSIDTLIASNQRKLDQLKLLKKWLLQNIFV